MLIESAPPAPRFFLGTHQTHWLVNSPVPLFVSDRRLRSVNKLRPAACVWALDSGGFTELSTYGSWEHGPSPQEYADRARRYRDQIGRMVWAAPQDWMCEDSIIAKTGLSVLEHQKRTIDNWFDLHERAPDLKFIKVLQGKRTDDYLQHIEMYQDAGIDLAAEETVGVGSVCRRQGTAEIGLVFEAIHRAGVTRLHGFGVKAQGLSKYGHLVASADSMAWSMAARREAPLPGCSGHKNCANCRRYALAWAGRMTELHEAAHRRATGIGV